MFARPSLIVGTTTPFTHLPFTQVCISPRERTKHTYVIGRTGMGKSSLLISLLLQDIAAGHGCAVIDPHSDLCTDLLGALHTGGLLAQVQHKIVYVNPADPQYAIPFNVLAVPGKPSDIADNVIEAFKRTWAESLKTAPHFTDLMKHSLLTLIKTHKTLAHLPRLLVDAEFRETLLIEAGDPHLIRYFHDRFEHWKDPLMLESTLNKVTALTLTPEIRLMLGQADNGLDWRKLMDEGYHVLVDIGQCSEETQRLLGSLMVCFIEQAAMSRANIPHHRRRPFYLTIDEFANFVAEGGDRGGVKSLSRILSAARKMGLHLTLSHQILAQLSDRMQGSVLGNVATKIIMGLAEQDALIFGEFLGLGNSDPEAIKQHPRTETQYPLYRSLPEQTYAWAAFLNRQRQRQAMVKTDDGRVRRIWTLPVQSHASPQVIDAIKQASLARYGNPTHQVEIDLEAFLNAPVSAPPDLLFEPG